VLGSYCAIALNDRRRLAQSTRLRTVAMILSGFLLGGVGIFVMHFVGMSALDYSYQGTPLIMKYDVGYTFLSLICSVAMVVLAFFVASQDRYWNLVTAAARIDVLAEDVKKVMNMQEVTEGGWKVLLVVLTRSPWYILSGGVIAGSGVCVMHFVGMHAQQFDGDISFEVGMVALSVLIAVTVASIGLFIIFRVLAFKVATTWRCCAAVIIGLAVCGMHYTGMYSCAVTYHPNKVVSLGAVDSAELTTTVIASGLMFAILTLIYLDHDLRQEPKPLAKVLKSSIPSGATRVSGATRPSVSSLPEPESQA